MTGQPPFTFAGPHESPGFLLWRASTTWRHLIGEATADYDLTHLQFVLLATTAWLEAQGAEATQTAVAELCGSDPNTVSATIRRMETKGLLRRTRGTSDARQRIVTLTPTGRESLANAAPAVEETDRQFFGDPANRDLLADLARICRNLVGD